MKPQSLECFLNISHFAYQIANQVIINLLMIRSNQNVQIKQLLSIQRLGNARNALMIKFVKLAVIMIWIPALHAMMILVQIYWALVILVYQIQSYVFMETVQAVAAHAKMALACWIQNALDVTIRIAWNVIIQKIAYFAHSNTKLLIQLYQISQVFMGNSVKVSSQSNEGFSIDCNNKVNSLDKNYPDCASCEIDPTNLTNITCKACVNGYIFNETGECLSKCPTGYYGVSIYSRRAMLEQSFCEKCNSSCEECFDSQYCKLCPIGQYLERLSFDKSYGNCQVKLQQNYTGVLYVTNIDISADVQTLDGSLSKPFGDMDDAITRAYELASQQSYTDITIYLQNTSDYGLNHYLLRTARDFYQPLLFERDSQSLKLIIKPDPLTVEEGQKITIFNKRRDKFQLRVGRGLTLENIIIDSLDSVLPIDQDGNGCLKRKENCCEMGSDGFISSNFNDSQCLDSSGNLYLQMQNLITLLILIQTSIVLDCRWAQFYHI
eukprot:403371551